MVYKSSTGGEGAGVSQITSNDGTVSLSPVGGTGTVDLSVASVGFGTVTSVSVIPANGVSGIVATSTTTPAITLTLGAITPSSVAASGTVTGSNLSGVNTGDQTITLTGAVTGSGTGSFATTIATPGTLTVSSSNSTITAHTHAITSSSAPGAAASILATDSSGIIGSTGTRIVKGWFSDLTVTNAISGGVTGNAGTVTGATFTTALTVNTGTVTLTGNVANTSVLTIGAGGVSVSGANTGDQTITLTGGVTGSGTGSFAATLATPGTLTVSSSNSNATAHTHAITSSSAPGASASILATDSSGIIGSTGTRIVKGWFTDLTVTNAIAGSITGNAATVTTNANLTGIITSVGNATSFGSFTSAQILAGCSDESGSGALLFGTTPTITTPVLNGTPTGTGVASAATASTLVLRDSSGNTRMNNIIEGYATTVTAAGTTTLVVGDKYQQYFTGSTTQTVQLPATSTLVTGHTYEIVNISSGTVTVNSSGSNLVQTMAANTTCIATCIGTALTTAADWSQWYSLNSATSGTVTAVSVAPANGFAGSSSGGATPALTLTTSITGVLLGNGTAISASSVTNDVQTKAAIVPNTAPSAGQIPVGNAGGTAYAPVSASGAFTLASTGAATIATPGTLTVSSTNSTATAHTHAITSSSAPGAAAAILATDSSGIIGSTGTRIVKIWATDLTVTNSIAGSITGNAGTVTTNANLTGIITSSGNSTSFGSFTSAQILAGCSDETGSGALVFGTSPTFVTPVLGVASATSLATSAASPLLLTNGQLITVALTSQTTGGATLTIPDFASVSDEFTFKTKTQTMSNKTFVAPALGTPASGVLTNCTGTASGLTSGNVTTNANLTGVITSVGNATSIASQTGTGTKFVVDTSPTLITPIIGVATGTSLALTTGVASTLNATGTWTPVWTGLTVVGTPTYIATWTKIGRLVFCSLTISSTVTTASTAGTTSFTGLPFTANGGSTSTAVNGNTLASIGVGYIGATSFTPTWTATQSVVISFIYEATTN